MPVPLFSLWDIKMKKNLAEYNKTQRQQYHTNKALGKCPRCGKPAIFGMLFCGYHYDKAKQYDSKRYPKRKSLRVELGKCLTCGIQLIPEFDNGCVTCCNCRSRYTRR